MPKGMHPCIPLPKLLDINMRTPLIHAFKKYENLSHSGKDSLAVVLGVILAYSISLYFNLSEELNHWFAGYESVQLDEIPFPLFVYALLSVWFSRRRMQEIRAEIQRRKQTEAQLSNSQQLYKTLFDGDLTGNVVLDINGNIGMHNRAFHRICGPVHQDLSACHLFSFDWPTFVLQLIQHKEINFNKLKVQRPDHRPCFVEARFVYVLGATETDQAQIHAYLVDMTEQYTIELDLERTLKENRVLARHAIQVQEQERKYIASEIHDETGQYLTAIRMDVMALQKSSPEQANAIAARIASNTQHVQQSIRALIKHLRPPSLDSLGLIGAVELLINDWRKLNPFVICHAEMQADKERLNDDINIVAYRIIQEGLTNITKHAEASEISIAITVISQSAPALQIEIRDDGKGMDTSQSFDGIGLVGMRERIQSLKGDFKLASSAEVGTVITASIPLETSVKSPTEQAHSDEQQLSIVDNPITI